MSAASSGSVPPPGPLHLRLPATSANLGPGFDSLGLAMALYLTIDAEVSSTGSFQIDATGRNADLCSAIEDNLVISTYADVLDKVGKQAPWLHLRLHNEIPLGMGCGSSAAALLAGVFLANHFGKLGWSGQQLLEEACRREGHPDNVAACFCGGMTVSLADKSGVKTVNYKENIKWNLLLALPSASLSTSKARALLPDHYSREDTVRNIQATALLVSAFAKGRGDLLAVAMQDRVHQPYRMGACPLLPRLLPLAGSDGVLGVALSGAGPSVLLIADPSIPGKVVIERIREAAGDPDLEVVETKLSFGAEASLEALLQASVVD